METVPQRTVPDNVRFVKVLKVEYCPGEREPIYPVVHIATLDIHPPPYENREYRRRNF